MTRNPGVVVQAFSAAVAVVALAAMGAQAARRALVPVAVSGALVSLASTVEQLAATWESGSGFSLLESGALRAAVAGDTLISPSITAAFGRPQSAQQSDTTAAGEHPLTARELRVAGLVAQGMKQKRSDPQSGESDDEAMPTLLPAATPSGPPCAGSTRRRTTMSA